MSGMVNGIKKRILKTKAGKALYKRAKKIYRFMHLKVIYPRLYTNSIDKKSNSVDANKAKLKKAVFVAVRNEEFKEESIPDNFRLVYKRLVKTGTYRISTHTLRSGFAGHKEYALRCKAMIRDIADADVVLISDSSEVIACLPLRKETRVIQLWHACGAFKKFGMSTAELIFGEDRKTLMKYPYHGNYSLVTVSSPEVVWAYEEAMSLEGKGVVKPVGVSRTDVFYDEEFLRQAKERVLKACPKAVDKKIILYAPTFRGRVAKAHTPEELDVAEFYKRYSKEYVLIIKRHPFTKRMYPIPEKAAEFAFDVTDELAIEDLLIAADVCITDYSSIVFEYSLFLRPMLFLAHDIDEYYDWRGFYYDYRDFVPGPICRNNADLMNELDKVTKEFDSAVVKRFRDRYMSACDGHATDRIMEYILQGS